MCIFGCSDITFVELSHSNPVWPAALFIQSLTATWPVSLSFETCCLKWSFLCKCTTRVSDLASNSLLNAPSYHSSQQMVILFKLTDTEHETCSVMLLSQKHRQFFFCLPKMSVKVSYASNIFLFLSFSITQRRIETSCKSIGSHFFS